MRTSKVSRKTNETDITVLLNLDGLGDYKIDSGVGFLDHMLDAFAKHSGIDIDLICKGDIEVDFHHSAEDIGIVLGSAIKEALGTMKGVTRYGNFLLPMDEALILTSLDISGRCYLQYDVEMPAQKIGDFDAELVKEFFLALCRALGLTLHIKMISGANAHHIAEAIFKGVARALRQAVSIEAGNNSIPSTKGVL